MTRKLKFHTTIFFKAIVIIVINTFLLTNFSTTYAWSNNLLRDGQDLAPESCLTHATFKEKFRAREVVLSHEAINQYIRESVAEIIAKNGSLVKTAIIQNGLEAYLIAIPGLLKKTGQFAHIGLGQQYGTPVIYIDAELALEDKETVIKHEMDEISQWENFRRELGRAPPQMREWIRGNIQLAREKAKVFHDNAHPLNALYEKYNNFNFAFDYIDKLCALSGYTEEALFYDPEESDDINLAAGSAATSQPATWIEKYTPALVGKRLVTLSMEGNIPEFEGTLAQDANTKGGLGIYFGDKLEGLAGIGMEAIGIQPGYLHTKEKRKVDYDKLVKKGILKAVYVGEDAITVWAGAEDPILKAKAREYGENIPVKVEVYSVNRGGTTSYILVSEMFDYLYNTPNLRDDHTASRIHRFMQEVILGKASYELLKRLELIPDIVHLNEAHVVVLAALLKTDSHFEKTKIVYTNHTLTPVGLEVFRLEDMNNIDIGRLRYLIGWPAALWKEFEEIFLVKGSYGKIKLDFCQAAFLLADTVNAVSDEHAIATEVLFKTIYGNRFNKKVTPALNGSGMTWVSKALQDFKRGNRFPSEEELWQIHEKSKEEAFGEIKGRANRMLDPYKPTIWAVRRIVEYKSQYPILRFLVHVVCAERERTFTKDGLRELWRKTIPELNDMDDVDKGKPYNRSLQNLHETAENILNALFGDKDVINGLGIQIVVAGPAWGYEEKKWVETFKNWSMDDRIPGFVYVPYSDVKLLRMQAIGADICINMPRPLEETSALEEACGTSDQRTGMNGGINIACIGAGPVEWITNYNESTGEGSGFLIGPYYAEGATEEPKADLDKFYRQAPIDIFQILGQCSRIFYNEKDKWKKLMRSSYMAAHYGDAKNGKKPVTAEAMEKRYARKIYLHAIGERIGEAADGLKELEPEVAMMLARLNGPSPKEEPRAYVIHEISLLAMYGRRDEALRLFFTTEFFQGQKENLDIPLEILNKLIEAYVKDRTKLEAVRDFILDLTLGILEFSDNDNESIEVAQSIQLMASQAFTVISWIDRGVKGVENIRLTIDNERMAQNEKHGSFIDKTTLPQGIEEVKKEGQAGYFWRGIEKIEKLGKKGENVLDTLKYDDRRFEAAKDKLVMYAMNHGFIEVPAALKEATATSHPVISTMHETSFINDLLPGSSQTTSTGAGHFQGYKLDIKHVTEGRGVQVNVLYDTKGKIVKILAQHIEEGDWCLALPGYVDYMINLGGLRFNDVSIKLAPNQASGFNPFVDFGSTEEVERLEQAVRDRGKYAPYVGVMQKGKEPIVVKTSVRTQGDVPDAQWIKQYNGWSMQFPKDTSLLSLYNSCTSIQDFYQTFLQLHVVTREDQLSQTRDDGSVMAASEMETAKASSLIIKAPSFDKVTGVYKFIDDNAGDLVKIARGEAKNVKLIRIPIQFIEAVGKDNIKDFIAALQDERSSAYIELFSMENIVAEISEDQYRKYDIPRKQKPLPSGFTSNRTNTITILPVSKDDTFATGGRKIEDAWSWELGGISPDKTIISPVGFNYDRSGLVRSILLGLRLSEIAKEPGDAELVSRTLAQYKALCVSQGQNPNDLDSSLTAQDLINMAKGDMSEMVKSLNLLIKFLPIIPINIEEMRLIFERAREVLIRA